MVKKQIYLKKYKQEKRDTKTNHRRAANTMTQCMSPTDVWNTEGAVQDMGELITSREFTKMKTGR